MKKKNLILLSLVSALTLSACGQSVSENKGIVSKEDEQQYLKEMKDGEDVAVGSQDEKQVTNEKSESVKDIDKLVSEAGKAYEKYLEDGIKSYEEMYGTDSVQTQGIVGGMLNTIGSVLGGSDSATTESFVAEKSADYAEESMVEVPSVPVQDPIWDTESYKKVDESGFTSVQTQPFSTFGADTDTAVYSSIRRKILGSDYDWYGYGIDNDAIRIEEMINYFKYDYKEPENGEKFGVTTTLNPCPWNDDTLLLKVGIKTEEATPQNGSNIVFLIDTSGSMYDFDKLPLVQEAFKTLTDSLNENDRVSIVTYAGSSEVVAKGISGDEHEKIKKLIDSLEAGGSTNGAEGIVTAYNIAEDNFIEGGNNRVILVTDGDLNVGVTSEAGLIDLIEKEKETGVMLSCLGFGDGNYQDDKMEALADHGNGNYAYIDCPDEAERVLKDEIWSTLYTVAKDTKFQVEFNPETVKGYRLIGYENRKMAAEDFADDTKDGGEIGQNQCVTVLYEIIPAGSDMDTSSVSSKYQEQKEETKEPGLEDELLTVNIRYKEPDADESILKEYPVTYGMQEKQMDDDTSWAAGVAQFGMLLRDSDNKGSTTYDNVYDRLKNTDGVADDISKLEFLYMVKKVGEDPEKYMPQFREVSDEDTVYDEPVTEVIPDTEGYDDYYGIADDAGILPGGCVVGTPEDPRLSGPTHYEGFEEMVDTDMDEITFVASGEYPDAPAPQIICNTSWAKVRLTANNGSVNYRPESITYAMEDGQRVAKVKFVKTSEDEIGTDVMTYYDVQVPFKYDVDRAEVDVCDEDGNILESAK